MSKKSFKDRYITVFVLLFFALALFIVGCVLRTRVGTFVQSYTENQTRKQAEAYALLMADKLNVELDNLEYIAGRLETSLDDMDGLMPKIYNEDGVKQGLLGIDGNALYGDSLDVSVFDGIQSSFRGKKVITYVQGEGLLFTCPVFNGPNIRYVLYRLCPEESLEERFATEIYEDLGKICVTDRDGSIVIPFYNFSETDTAWYTSEGMRKKYATMHGEMEVSVAVARTFYTQRGQMLLFESEIPGTDYLVSGFVPRYVAAEGIEKLTLLIVWVFGLLMVLVLVGAVYLTRAVLKIRESEALREAKAAAEEASRAKSDFLANMSHEIRTPINAILGMNEMILRESRDDEIATYASNIKTAGNSLLGIINDILYFSKMEVGKVKIIPVEYSLPGMLNGLVNMINSRAREKGLELILDFDPRLPTGLFGDEGRIKQVITNLLTNAVKYTGKGSVTFGIHYEDVGEEEDAILLKVSVKDTGIGIKAEDMEKLFLEFERIEERRNRSVEGTGLGLSITKNLLEMMDSSLEVESVYGEGSTFGFTLEQRVTDRKEMGDFAAFSMAAESVREEYHERFSAPGARVLMVDDNDMNLVVFRSLLKKTGMLIDTALDGDEGIGMAKKTRYDVIFLDHMMPGKDGIETLHEIRSSADNPNVKTPTVCLTANAIYGAREEYLKAGFDDYLTKPLDPEMLEQTILRYLSPELVQYGASEDADMGELPEGMANLAGILDVEAGITNSGDPDSYLALLKLFYGSAKDKAGELDGFYRDENINDYTIKVHALKSSAKVIGAADLGEEAQRLEDAGKAGDMDYIHSHHRNFLDNLLELAGKLEVLFPVEAESEEKPEADESLMRSVFRELMSAAVDMDCDRIEDTLSEIEAYSIPKKYRELYEKLVDAAQQYDYDGMKKLLEEEI
ncbi:MAG: response regulator [Lachnospiraceae bacterium]|nr:response regulator [Lachnospiraceae bacterium]